MSQTLNVETPESAENNHFLATHYPQVADIMADLGYENSMMDMLKPPIHEKIPEGNIGVTPTFSKPIRDMIQKSQLPFTLDDEVEGCFGGGKGSANTTTTFEKTGMAMSEAFEILHLSGQLSDALKVIKAKRDKDNDPSAVNILTYAMATFTKGWRAEKFLEATDRFKTGSVSQDQGGMDLYDTENDEWIQLKPMTVLASNGTGKYENKKFKHMFYMWTGDGDLKVTDTEGYKEVKNDEAEKVGVSSTLLIKSAGNLKVTKETRSFRYLFW